MKITEAFQDHSLRTGVWETMAKRLKLEFENRHRNLQVRYLRASRREDTTVVLEKSLAKVFFFF